MEFFKDNNEERDEFAGQNHVQEADKTYFSRGLDISKIKVGSKIFV